MVPRWTVRPVPAYVAHRKIMNAHRRLALMSAIMLAGCMTARDIREQELPVLVVTDQNRMDAALLEQHEYRYLRGAAPGETPGSELWQRRAIANALHADYYRNREGASYRSRVDSSESPDLPCWCLALSGGGMRSLAFSTGALSALQRLGIYPQVDVVSAVSGGAYASYWTLSHARKGATEAQILSGADSPQLTRLRAHANGLTTAATKTRMVVGGSPPVPGTRGYKVWYVNKGLELLTSVFGDLQFKPAGSNLAYGSALHKMLTDSKWFLPQFKWMTGFKDLVDSGRVPLPVWLTTARPAQLPDCVGTDPDMEIIERNRSLLWSAFEISPLRMGSEELGFLVPEFLFALEALAASGAGMDLPYNERCRLLTLISASVRVHNYPVLRGPAEIAAADRRLQPFVPDFWLIDGGLADVLAVFPLVRRLCADIIVIDAEFDPYLVFPGYDYLKQHLARQDIVLEVPELEELAARNRSAVAPGDPGAHCKDGICFVAPKPECIVQDASAGCVPPDSVPTTIFQGRIGPIPIATPAPSDAGGPRWTYGERTLRIHYVKLALDAASIDAYPMTVRERHAEHAERRRSISSTCTSTRDTGACSFPQESTADLDFRDGQFEAYWDLGRCTIERFWPVGAGRSENVRCDDSVWPAIDRRPPQK